MNLVIEKLQNLFKDEDWKRRHLIFLLIFILSNILSQIIKGFGIVSYILILGYIFAFITDRMHGKLGIPEFDFKLFEKGVKLIPLSLVWGIYFMIAFFIFIVIPGIILMIVGANIFMSASYTYLLLFFGGLALGLIVLIASSIAGPFLMYINFSFIEDNAELNGKYFNPILIFEYGKKAFKSTICAMLKFLMANLLVFGINILFAFCIFSVAYASGFSVTDLTPDNLIGLNIIGIITGVVMCITSYLNSLLGFASIDAYYDIYKTQIKEPEETYGF